jgi:hypothetical protein
MESARAAKDKQSKREIQVRVRSGSKGRDDTWLKHDSFQMKAEERACISGTKSSKGRKGIASAIDSVRERSAVYGSLLKLWAEF